MPARSTPPRLTIHEVIGDSGVMAGPRVAELNRLAGQAARRLETQAGRDFFAKVFWFSIESGSWWKTCSTHPELRAYCAWLSPLDGRIKEPAAY